MTILLIHPPVVKPSEPPAGIARLAGALRSRGIPCAVWDANIEGLLFLMGVPCVSSDRWTTRAVRTRSRHLASLKNPRIYRHPDRYRRAVADINRLLEIASRSKRIKLSLTDYHDTTLSPVRSSDLIRSFMRPEENPLYPFFHKRITARVETNDPTHIGFSLNFLSQALCAFAMIGFVKRQWPELPVVLGGGLITSWMRRPGWRNPFGTLVDHIVAGPGERTLLSLLGASGTGAPIQAPDPPEYDGFPMAEYVSPGFILPFSASGGCYWNRCSFCPERAEKNPYVPIQPARAARDIRTLVDNTGPVLLHMLDNAMSPSLMNALVVEPPHVPWYGFTRITSHLADADFCHALKQSGCIMLKLGLESGDQRVLDKEHKGIDIDIASCALHTLKQAGIATYVYLLFGTPSETEAAARETLNFVLRHSDAIDFLNLAIFNLPLHGPDTRQLVTNSMYEGDLSLYTGFRHPQGWDRALVRRFLNKEFKKQPAVQSILRKHPPLFTSNHAPFFTPAFNAEPTPGRGVGSTKETLR